MDLPAAFLCLSLSCTRCDIQGVVVYMRGEVGLEKGKRDTERVSKNPPRNSGTSPRTGPQADPVPLVRCRSLRPSEAKVERRVACRGIEEPQQVERKTGPVLPREQVSSACTSQVGTWRVRGGYTGKVWRGMPSGFRRSSQSPPAPLECVNEWAALVSPAQLRWRGAQPKPACSYLVDPASSHMLVSKIKPCMSKYKPH